MVRHSPRLRVAMLVTLVLAALAAAAEASGRTWPVAEAAYGSAIREVSPDPAQTREPARLRSVIEEHYRVVPMQDGVMLVPRRENTAVKSIEVRGDTVAINGSAVTGAELRDRLKSDSDAILALSYLDPAARRALFESTSSKVPEQPPAEPSGTEPEASGHEAPSPSASARTEWRGGRNDARVHIGGPVHVAENETIDGPVVSVGGSVTVDGDVRDDVVAIGGNVRLGPKARVRGDVTSVGGTVERDPAAEIDGKTNEIDFTLHNLHLGGIWFPAAGVLTFGPWVHMMATLFRMVLFAVLAILVFLIAYTPISRIEQAAAIEPWKAGFVGLLTELLFLPVFILTIVILAVSIIGIPLLFFVPPLAIVALIAAFIFGFTGVAYRIGRGIQHRFSWAPQSPFVLLLVGLVAIWALTIAGRIVSLGGWPIWFVSWALLLTGFLVEYVAWTVGLGAAVMTRFGTRPASGGVMPVAGATAPTGPQGGGVA